MILQNTFDLESKVKGAQIIDEHEEVKHFVQDMCIATAAKLRQQSLVLQ
jgi:hypothetical protein